MSRNRGYLFIISAPSGAGKTTLAKAILERYADLLYSVSFTTRKPRAVEQDGVDYHFIQNMISKKASKREIGRNGPKYMEIIMEHPESS